MPKEKISVTYTMGELLNVITVSEAAEWWGRSNKGIINALVMEEKRTDRLLIRKSGGTWITTVSNMVAVFGQPVNARPECY